MIARFVQATRGWLEKGGTQITRTTTLPEKSRWYRNRLQDLPRRSFRW